MINTLNKLTSITSICGSEDDLAVYLADLLSIHGLSVKSDAAGNVIAHKPGTAINPKRIMLQAPIDRAGLICLYQDKKTASLSALGDFSEYLPQGKSVISSDGTSVQLPNSIEDFNEIIVPPQKTRFGEIYRLPSEIRQEKKKLIGQDVSFFARIHLLLELCQHSYQNDLILLFSSQGSTRQTNEKNAILQEKPDKTILLGVIDAKNTAPRLLIRDGKSFSNKDLSDMVLSLDPSLIPTVSQKPVTKLDSALQASPYVLSIALPCERIRSDAECVSVTSIKKMSKLLEKILNT